MKNKSLMALNIEAAIKELNHILDDLTNDPEYSEIELKTAFEHAYHLLNFAWNIRSIDKERAAGCSEQDFRTWSKYPGGEISDYE